MCRVNRYSSLKAAALVLLVAVVRGQGVARAAESSSLPAIHADGNGTSTLSLSIVANRDPVLPGEGLLYTLTVSNRGPVALNDFELRTLMPDWIRSFSDSTHLSDGGSCPGFGGSNLFAFFPAHRIAPRLSRTALIPDFPDLGLGLFDRHRLFQIALADRDEISGG